ncbi:hypothetical protein KIPB_000561 [Kipferlia bialata]|uniref:HD domain-containing protein n=1 Tax=Kipferlia bialata TaxID=797122 RepID=A0A9K3GEI3_9EUKA|nr:hypothetical protein KIPB_000561 [Kipferlia bialata]|eukprot:g561.t1
MPGEADIAGDSLSSRYHCAYNFDVSITDPIHKVIEVPGYAVDVLNTQAVQRLRGLRQLGTAHYVYPGATHTRFEHSLGTMHLAGQLLSKVSASQPGLRLTHRERKIVTLAALCHDLGHGPFSHAWDSGFLRAMGIRKEHEAMSVELVHRIAQENDDLEDCEVTAICDCIEGRKTGERGWLYDIVSNSQCGLDVDKLDYLERDSVNVGPSMQRPDTAYILQASRFVGDKWAFQVKTQHAINEIFGCRYSLFSRVYSHKTSSAVELMVTDALVQASDTFRLTDSCHDLDLFLKLNDGILDTIRMYPAGGFGGNGLTQNPKMDEAKAILQRVDTRNTYKLAFGIRFAKDMMNDVSLFDIFETKQFRDRICRRANVSPELVRVQKSTIGYGGKGKDGDPMTAIPFFKKPLVGMDIELEFITSDGFRAVKPVTHSSYILRVYITDNSIHEAIRHAAKQEYAELTARLNAMNNDNVSHLDETMAMSPVHPASKRGIAESPLPFSPETTSELGPTRQDAVGAASQSRLDDPLPALSVAKHGPYIPATGKRQRHERSPNGGERVGEREMGIDTEMDNFCIISDDEDCYEERPSRPSRDRPPVPPGEDMVYDSQGIDRDVHVPHSPATQQYPPSEGEREREREREGGYVSQDDEYIGGTSFAPYQSTPNTAYSVQDILDNMELMPTQHLI